MSGDQTTFRVQWVIHRWPDRGFALATFGEPCFAEPVGDVVRRTLSIPHEELDLTELRGHLETLWAEAERLAPPPEPPILPGGVTMPVYYSGEHLSRTVQTDGRPTLKRNWERKSNADLSYYDNQEREIESAALSSAGQRALYIFDNVAVRDVAQRYRGRLEHLSSGGTEPPPEPPSQFAAFVSYRKPQLPLAQRVHKTFEGFGHGAHFRAFLDTHDTKLGDWAAQYFEAIERSDLFVAVCTPDYAAEGSFSLAELRHAIVKGVPLAVLAVGLRFDQLPADLEKRHACALASDAEVTPENPGLQKYIATCVETLREART
jgi:hypothetical protein